MALSQNADVWDQLLLCDLIDLALMSFFLALTLKMLYIFILRPLFANLIGLFVSLSTLVLTATCFGVLLAWRSSELDMSVLDGVLETSNSTLRRLITVTNLIIDW